MSVLFYIIPLLVVISPAGGIERGPAYLYWYFNPTGIHVQWACKDYGLIDSVVLCAVNTDAAQHAWLASQAGVYQLPANLETNPSPAEISVFTSLLEASYVPADWITPAETWRTMARTVGGMFLFMQRLTGITGDSPLEWGITLNTRFDALSQEHQDAIVLAYTSLGYDPGVIRDNWTIRVLLKNFADQWGTTPILFGFAEL